jgi:hypothetical protein
VTTNRARTATVLVLLATVLQLAVAAALPDLPQFAGKGFGARLALYPAMMLLVPAAWWLRERFGPGRRADAGARAARSDPPWAGFAVLMSPFLIDVTGNSLDLYDRVVWWDDANHLVNWFLLCLGLGLVLLPGVAAPRWVLAGLVTGGGALLAIVWELGEWFTFIRFGTELATAYEDTLGDETLGSLGAGLAAAVLLRTGGPVRSQQRGR